MLYDTHAHLDDPKLFPDISGVLQRAAEAGLGHINTVGCDWKSSLMSVHIAEKFSTARLQLHAVVGVHPHEVKELDAGYLTRLSELAASDVVKAWGEIGLDYYHDLSPREMQRRVFAEQIEAAKSLRLPIIIHDRDAHQDTLDILKQHRAGVNGGVLHCFSGSWEMAKECLKLGFLISFAGPLTYHNARALPEVAQKTPADMLLIETDCPYLTPEPFRGRLNEPARVAYVAERLAQLRGVEYEQIAELTTANACRLLGIK